MDEVNEITGELMIHQTEYIVRIKAMKSQLEIELEDKHSGDYWRNTFSQHYIEEITQKTGNYKKYQVFIKMLADGINKKTESVVVDILTMQDLENMKQRNKTNIQTNTNNTNNNSNQKRYLILSYLVQYDKVHYPLPLILDENPDLEQLKKTIRRLRFENDELKEKQNRRSNSMGISQNNFMEGQKKQEGNSQMVMNSEAYKELQRTNNRLKEDMEYMQQQQQGALDYDNNQKDHQELTKQYQLTKEKHMREISRLQSELEMRDGLQIKGGQEEEINALVKQVTRQSKTIDELQMELQKQQTLNKKSNQQIKLLEDDLLVAQKNRRGNSITDRLYNNNTYNTRSKNNTPSVISKASAQSRPSNNRGQQQKIISTQSRATSKDSKANSVKQWDRKQPDRKPLYPTPTGNVQQQKARRAQVEKNQRDQYQKQQNILASNRNKFSPAHSVGSNKKSSYSYSSYNSNKVNMNRVKTTIDNNNNKNKKDQNIFKRNVNQPDFISRNKQVYGTSSQNSKGSRNASSSIRNNKSPYGGLNNNNNNNYNRKASPVVIQKQPYTRQSPNSNKSNSVRQKSPYIVGQNNKYNDTHLRNNKNNNINIKGNRNNKDENLLQKLEDLKNRNNSSNKNDSKNIEDRLSKLQELLRMAKN